MEIDRLNEKQITKGFHGPHDLLHVETFEEVPSTNDVAKEMLKKHPDNLTLIATNKQTEGRGRHGKSFYSKLQHGLYFTFAFFPNDHRLESIPLYTILTATALVETLAKYVEEPLAIKWINDIFYRGKKVSGILSEMVTGTDQGEVPGLVVGVGINLAGDFSQSDRATQAVAGTLFGEETPDHFNQNQFLSEFLDAFFSYHRHFQEKTFMPIYEAHLLGVGQEVSYTIGGKEKRGVIQGINEQGHLLVLQPDRSIETLYGQEVHFGSQQFLHENISQDSR